ncbi:hypothetical protein HPB48_021261 [Haemaphysalis longicornis]|uniref:RNase H type-1 domain-containing protein n=1 Tax=Haemaphysalis longicornis TaxID=44386 RepID=A0A9J6H244_HAELO|nr:hypothetical protein HPB48_021261 [Haemaphysalis longicornis]
MPAVGSPPQPPKSLRTPRSPFQGTCGLVWTPAHSCLPGNELAHEAAGRYTKQADFESDNVPSVTGVGQAETANLPRDYSAL